MFKVLLEGYENAEMVEVTNIERQIDWQNKEGRKFRIVLSCPRK